MPLNADCSSIFAAGNPVLASTVQMLIPITMGMKPLLVLNERMYRLSNMRRNASPLLKGADDPVILALCAGLSVQRQQWEAAFAQAALRTTNRRTP